ncbi:MAG: hypothetical protein ACI4EQ_06075 [Lachnospiraceae bacterium]
MEKRIIAYRKYMDRILEQLRSVLPGEGARAEEDKTAGEGARAEEGKTAGEGARAEEGKTAEEDIRTQVEALKKEHLTQISFFQHERLVHLIVTVTFAILEMLAVLTALLFPGIATLLLVVVVMVLLIPYIRHYYILENEVQKMYGQYDRLNALLGEQCEKSH